MDFRISQGCLIPVCLPHEQRELNEKEVKQEIIKRKAYFARYTSGFSTPPHQFSEYQDIKEWWFCIKDSPIDLKSLTAKQRYRINKGLKLNEIRIVEAEDEQEFLEPLAKVLREALEDYPAAYRNVPSIEKARNWIHGSIHNPKEDLWMCRDKESGEVTGFAFVPKYEKEKVAILRSVKVPTRFLKNEVNAALGFKIVDHYINEKGFYYICDGERNVRHITNYQDFLIRVLNFRLAYTRLFIVYHPRIKPLVSILYPFKKIIALLGRKNQFAYNVSCILFQEKIARKYRTK